MKITLERDFNYYSRAPRVWHGGYSVSKRTARTLMLIAHKMRLKYKGRLTHGLPAYLREVCFPWWVEELGRVASIYPNGTIRLGCQTITWADISRFARKQKWI